MKRKKYKHKRFALYSTLINEVVGSCSGKYLAEVGDHTTRYIPITDEEADREKGVKIADLQGRPMYKAKIITKVRLVEDEV